MYVQFLEEKKKYMHNYNIKYALTWITQIRTWDSILLIIVLYVLLQFTASYYLVVSLTFYTKIMYIYQTYQ